MTQLNMMKHRCLQITFDNGIQFNSFNYISRQQNMENHVPGHTPIPPIAEFLEMSSIYSTRKEIIYKGGGGGGWGRTGGLIFPPPAP